jgi:dTDP-glucose pyrophosphorylase
MNTELEGTWENEAQELIKRFRSKAKGINNFTALEDLALEEGRKLTKLLMQGSISDKGDGKSIGLPEEMKNSKAKNKGIKKKTNNQSWRNSFRKNFLSYKNWWKLLPSRCAAWDFCY